MKAFYIIAFFFCLNLQGMEKEANSDAQFQEQIKYLCSQKQTALNTKRIKKWGLFEIYINEYGSVKRKTNFQPDDLDAGDNGDFPPAMGSYLTDEYLIQVPEDRWFGEFICWARSLIMKKVITLNLSPKDNFLITVVERKYHWDGWADYPLIGLALVNLHNKNTENIELPDFIPLEELKVDTKEEALKYINEGYSFNNFSSNKKYYLNNDKISALAVSNDGNKIALANNSLICIMQRTQTSWDHQIIKKLIATQKVTDLKEEYGSTPKSIFWPQKIAFLQFNQKGNKLAVGYYEKDPKPLSRREIWGARTIDKLPQETEIISLND